MTPYNRNLPQCFGFVGCPAFPESVDAHIQPVTRAARVPLEAASKLCQPVGEALDPAKKMVGEKVFIVGEALRDFKGVQLGHIEFQYD